MIQQSGLAGYEPETLACFLACLDTAPDGAFYDIGANVGVFSWLAAAAGDRRVVAFEPTPDIASVCAAIADHNQLAIDVQAMAVGDEQGTATLYLSSTSDCSNSLDRTFRKASGTVEVPLTTVDAFANEHGDSPSILKIDTEKTEAAVLRGARRLLEARRTWLLLEILVGQERGLESLLEPLGYSCYQVTHERALVKRRELFADRTNTYRNWLFVPRDLDDEFFARMADWREQLEGCEAETVRQRIEAPVFLFGTDSKTFAQRWRPTESPKFQAALDGESVRLSSQMAADKTLYFYHGRTSFTRPGERGESVACAAGRQYQIELDVAGDSSNMLRTSVWVLQYDDKSKIDKQRVYLNPGTNTMAFDAHPEARSLRLAFRAAGPGTITLGPVSLFRVGRD